MKRVNNGHSTNLFKQFSPVEMTDCTSSGGNYAGCNGNTVEYAYTWAKN